MVYLSFKNIFVGVLLLFVSCYFYNNNSYDLCNKCIHTQCPIFYIHNLCQEAQINNTIYSNIYEENINNLSELNILKKYAFIKGNEVDKCVKKVRNMCSRFCNMCIEQEDEPLNYNIYIQAQNYTNVDVNYEDCLLNQMNIPSICWISINSNKCIEREFNKIINYCS